MIIKKEIEIKNPQKILPWIGAPFMAAWVLEGIILIVGFTPHLLFVNYLIEGLFVFLFCISYSNKIFLDRAGHSHNVHYCGNFAICV